MRPARQLLLRLGVVLATTAVAMLLRWSLRPVLGDAAPFLLFIPAIIICAWQGGFWAGLGATVLGVLLARFVIVRHAAEAQILPNQFLLYSIYGLIGLLISGLVEAMNRARVRAVMAREELRRAKEAVESASRSKDAFLAALSH